MKYNETMINLKGIKNIIFDLGGVILNIDPRIPEKRFRELGIENFASIYSHTIQIDLFDKLERGLIKPGAFRNEIRNFIPTEVSDRSIDDAWNSMLLDIPPGRIKVLEKLKLDHQIFLLSNTNKIHYDKYSSDIQKIHGYENLEDIFKKVYVSFEVGLQKPAREIFEFVLNDSTLVPEETLFIDDTLKHIEGASKVGIRGFHLEKGMEITRIFT